MSGIYIHMEMPKSCADCKFCGYYGKGVHMCDITANDVEYTEIEKIRDNCPLIPIPEHGRLIDADAIEATVQDLWMQNEISNGDWIAFREMLNSEPTIIPEDKGEEE